MPKYRVKVTLTETRTKVLIVEAPHEEAAIFSINTDAVLLAKIPLTRNNTRVEVLRKETPR